MSSDGFLTRVAATHGCSPDLVRAVATACLAALNETSYKRGTADAVAQAHVEIGDLAAWHLMGLVVDAAERGDPGALVRAYARIDADASRFDPIATEWGRELDGPTRS